MMRALPWFACCGCALLLGAEGSMALSTSTMSKPSSRQWVAGHSQAVKGPPARLEFDDSLRISRAVLGDGGGGASGGGGGGEAAGSDGVDWSAVRDAVRRRGPMDDCPICMTSLGASDLPPVERWGAAAGRPPGAALLARPLACLSCAHVYHAHCIEAFERFHPERVNLCPVCRGAYCKRVVAERCE